MCSRARGTWAPAPTTMAKILARMSEVTALASRSRRFLSTMTGTMVPSQRKSSIIRGADHLPQSLAKAPQLDLPAGLTQVKRTLLALVSTIVGKISARASKDTGSGNRDLRRPRWMTGTMARTLSRSSSTLGPSRLLQLSTSTRLLVHLPLRFSRRRADLDSTIAGRSLARA